MNRKAIRILLTIFCAMILSIPLAAQAAGTVQFDAGSGSVKKGERITVEITLTSDVELAALRASIVYDASKLAYQGGGGNSAQLSGGTGSIVEETLSGKKSVTYAFQFTALQEGEATVNVVSSELIDVNGNVVGTPSGGISITIQSATVPEQTPTPEKDPIAVSIDGQERYLAWEIDWDLPEGFTLSQTEYDGNTIQAGRDSERGLVVVQTYSAAGESAYYLYHETTGTFFPFVLLNYNGAYTVLQTEQSLEGYTETQLYLQGQMVQAWQTQQMQQAGRYLIYAAPANGSAGFYCYDVSDGTIQRVLLEENVVQPTPSATLTEPIPQGMWTFPTILSLGLTGICVILILAVVILLVKNHREKKRESWD